MQERYLGIRVDSLAHYAPTVVRRLQFVLDKLGYTIIRGTYGHEVSLKAKKSHFHWHIQVQAESFYKHPSKQIKTAYDKQVDHDIENDPTLGTTDDNPIPGPLTNYAIKVVDKPDDDNRFFRYPFKDLDDIDQGLQFGFTYEELNTMLTQAKTEREIAKKTFEKHENKLNNDKQNRTLLWEYLDAQFPDIELRLHKLNPDRSNDPCKLVGTAIVKYNTEFNDYRIPMDLKRRTICYLAYRGLSSDLICDILWK